MNFPMWSRELEIRNTSASGASYDFAASQGRRMAAYMYCHSSGVFFDAMREEMAGLRESTVTGLSTHLARIEKDYPSQSAVKPCKDCDCCQDKC